MPYVTLQEASEILLRETEVDITVPQLIRAGAVNGLPMCVLLDVECYSPTHQMRREKKAEEQDPEYWGKVRPKSDGELDYAYGCFVLPPRHVFAFQTKDTVRIDSVTSLDGNDTYYPGVDIRRDELQIMLPHLGKFIALIKASQSKAKPAVPKTPESDSPQENQAISGVDRNDKPNVTVHKLRENSLDAPIRKAIAMADSRRVGAVFVQLRELAIIETAPLTGVADDGAIEYCNDESKKAKLTKGALGKRIKRL